MIVAPYISWEITDDCNHNCFYCYNYWRGDEEHPHTGHINYEKICDFIIEQHPHWVSITGGEPLLEWERVSSIFRKFSFAGIGIRLVTNGSLITEEIAKCCAEHSVQVMLSFPAVDRDVFAKTTGSNTYDSVLNGVDLLKAYGVDFTFNVVVTAQNIDCLSDTVKFLSEQYGIRRLFVSRATKPVNASGSLQEELLDYNGLQKMFSTCVSLKDKYKIIIKSCGGFPFCAIPDSESFEMFAKGCGAGEAGYVISGNGDIRACARDYVTHGNIFETPISEILTSIAKWGTHEALPAECRLCNVKDVCRGGCRMASKAGIPSFDNLDCDAKPENQPVVFNNYNEKCMSRRLGTS